MLTEIHDMVPADSTIVHNDICNNRIEKEKKIKK